MVKTINIKQDMPPADVAVCQLEIEIEALKNTECDEVTLVLNGSLSPMIVKPVDGESFIFLVVPMRLNDEI